jgi:hypothetical protein
VDARHLLADDDTCRTLLTDQIRLDQICSDQIRSDRQTTLISLGTCVGQGAGSP